jgi:hypothetical protein
VLWAIAQKLRVHARECDYALALGLVDVLRVCFLEGHHPPLHIELALSCLFELCRYPAGCQALARGAEALLRIVCVPAFLGRLGYSDDPLKASRATIETALIDVLGRALVGLADDPDALRAFATTVEAGDLPCPKTKAAKKSWKRLQAQLQRAQDLKVKSSEAWHPHYVMERGESSPFAPKISYRTSPSPLTPTSTSTSSKNAIIKSCNNLQCERVQGVSAAPISMKTCARCRNAFCKSL